MERKQHLKLFSEWIIFVPKSLAPNFWWRKTLLIWNCVLTPLSFFAVILLEFLADWLRHGHPTHSKQDIIYFLLQPSENAWSDLLRKDRKHRCSTISMWCALTGIYFPFCRKTLHWKGILRGTRIQWHVWTSTPTWSSWPLGNMWPAMRKPTISQKTKKIDFLS